MKLSSAFAEFIIVDIEVGSSVVKETVMLLLHVHHNCLSNKKYTAHVLTALKVALFFLIILNKKILKKVMTSFKISLISIGDITNSASVNTFSGG